NAGRSLRRWGVGAGAIGIDGGLIEQLRRRRVGGKERLDRCAQVRLVSTGGVQKRGTFGRRFRQRFVKESFFAHDAIFLSVSPGTPPGERESFRLESLFQFFEDRRKARVAPQSIDVGVGFELIQVFQTGGNRQLQSGDGSVQEFLTLR